MDIDTEHREPLATKTNVAAVKPMQHHGSKLPGPTPKGSRLPAPTASATRLPMPGVGSASLQQKRKASSPNRENVSKRTKLDSTSTVKAVLSKPVKQVPKRELNRPTRNVATAVRPSANTRSTVAKQPPKTTVPARKPVVTNNRGGAPNTAKNGPAKRTGTNSANTSADSSSDLKLPTGGKKRAPWDLKGRLIDMEALMKQHLSQNTMLQDMMTQNKDRIHQLEGQKQTLEVKEKDKSLAVADLERKLRKSEDELESTTREMKRLVDDFEFSKSTWSRQKTSLEDELGAAQIENRGLKNTVSEMSSSHQALKSEVSVVKINLERALEEGRLKDSQIADLKKMVQDRDEIIEECNSRLREEETTRRKMHNTIQELKGNIRVFCRVRPLLGVEREGNDGDIQHINFPENDDKTLELEKLSDIAPNETLSANRKGNNKYEFSFDRVFTPSSTQEEVFEEISQLVQSSLDGYNVCIFAYGQTGSGKTFTMEGPDEITPETKGMIPRAVAQVFETAAELQDKGWMYEFDASFLEIYNETIRDLLGKSSEDTKYEIKMAASNSNETYVSNLTIQKVLEESQVEKLLAQASENRAVAATNCNERSSRSHSVFRLKIQGHNKITDEKSTGLLNLIDLAGSERLKDSGSQGARLKETQCINKSLSNLGNVIMALANKESHIPYRNSKLTHLLQNSLGGNSKTLMFVNVSPKEECCNETINSLRFATKVNSCSIGTATKKVKL